MIERSLHPSATAPAAVAALVRKVRREMGETMKASFSREVDRTESNVSQGKVSISSQQGL
jgi:hypothetical protein